MHKTAQKGFTLIELLVVIAIIAVLSVVVILTLNPAQLLAQARDSTRISDLNVVKSALSLYLADVSPVDFASSTYCHYSVATTTGNGTCNGRYNASSSFTALANGIFLVNGNGWVPVNLTAISSGAPIGNLPKDPTNTAGAPSSTTSYYYTYRGSSTSTLFKLVGNMESTKYAGGTGDVEGTDGGMNALLYETGTDLLGI